MDSDEIREQLWQHRGLLCAIRRLPNSRNGNPRFELWWREAPGTGWPDHVANTAADSAFAYEIGNTGLSVGDRIGLVIGGRGTITYLGPLGR